MMNNIINPFLNYKYNSVYYRTIEDFTTCNDFFVLYKVI